MTHPEKSLRALYECLFAGASSSWLEPQPTLDDVLSGREFHEGKWDGWGRYIPTELKEKWSEVPKEVRIVAYRVAVEGMERTRDLLEQWRESQE